MTAKSILTRFSSIRQPARRATGSLRSRRFRSSGLPRIFEDHRSVEAVQHRRLFAALVEELGPLSPLARREAWHVAALGVEREATTAALAAGRHTRAHGPGRRPSPRDVEKLARRAGLAAQSYGQALDRLRELAVRNSHGQDLASQLAQLHEERP